MRVIEDRCVSCPDEMDCVGISCPNRNAIIYICDFCKSEKAEYRINSDDYCKYCADRYLSELFSELSVTEKLEALGVKLYEMND